MHRSWLPILTVIILSACTSKNKTLAIRDFGLIYKDSLAKKHPSVKFNLIDDSTILSNIDSTEFRYSLDNAFREYKLEPDSIGNVIKKYVDATEDLFALGEPVKIDRIVPIIKPLEYLQSIKPLQDENPGEKGFDPLYEKYNSLLIITYAEDKKNSFHYLRKEDFSAMQINMDSLNSLAMQNLMNIIPDIKISGDKGLYMVTLNGDYEVSLILLKHIWTKENFDVDGDFVIAIPNRDVLIVTGSNDKKGISKLKEIAADSYKNGSYNISENLFKWNGKQFQPFD